MCRRQKVQWQELGKAVGPSSIPQERGTNTLAFAWVQVMRCARGAKKSPEEAEDELRCDEAWEESVPEEAQGQEAGGAIIGSLGDGCVAQESKHRYKESTASGT
eukprot:CAMPEP_0115179156 /NCGR_PEP_ID=MMETSP0270-20121206/6267_1 /TAXON_ID=71861 /ORGANISM="Scrippsiella trochoidea, Strain CCMP3099" /LENGTH=103 /DNA_ID=CAMNT_0002592133 /DNA_START=670 /DNA_END=981 /DNA_ORIENTATION=-